MKTIIAGIVLIIGGIWARAHYAPVVAICHSGLGGFVQAFSQSAHQDCGAAQAVVTLAPWAIGVGVVMLAVSVLYLLGILGSLAASGNKKPQTGK
jgi:hypothetical protein